MQSVRILEMINWVHETGFRRPLTISTTFTFLRRVEGCKGATPIAYFLPQQIYFFRYHVATFLFRPVRFYRRKVVRNIVEVYPRVYFSRALADQTYVF